MMEKSTYIHYNMGVFATHSFIVIVLGLFLPIIIR